MRRAGRGGGRVFLFIVTVAIPALAGAAEVLFPQPLHLTRRIEDPFAPAPIVVDEYCAGNRVVSVRADRVVIVDYERQELTEIDRAAATYSIARFDEIARAAPQQPQAQTQRVKTAPRSLGVQRGESGRAVERFAVDNIELGVDREIKLPRAAVDVLLGGAYPNQRSPQHESLTAAAAGNLPAEQVIKAEFEGREIVVRNVVTRVGSELVSPDLLSIPPGAKRVESRYTAALRTAAELDQR